LNLKAARKQADAGPADADETILVKQDYIKREMHAVSLEMHNQDGHAMNYGQRIIFLREIQGRDIRSIFEKLSAARVGLGLCAGLALPPLPRWNAEAGNNLQEIIRWSSEAARRFDSGRRSESIVKCVLRVVADGLIAGGQAAFDKQMSQIVDSHTLSVNISKENLKIGLGDVPRLISLAVGIESSRGQAFSIVLQPPVQEYRGAGEPNLRSWKREPIRAIKAVGAWDGLNGTPLASPSLRNTQPLGTWTLTIEDKFSDDGSIASSYTRRPGQLGPVSPPVSDVVLSMSLAVRRVSQ
jgi:hypothetical protein